MLVELIKGVQVQANYLFSDENKPMYQVKFYCWREESLEEERAYQVKQLELDKLCAQGVLGNNNLEFHKRCIELREILIVKLEKEIMFNQLN